MCARVLIAGLAAWLVGFSSGESLADSDEPLARSFELIYRSGDNSFAGRSNFRESEGKPEISTDLRIEFLRLLADRLVQEGGDLVDSPVVPDDLLEQTRDSLRSLPLPSVRDVRTLLHWKWQMDAEGVASDSWSQPGFDDHLWNSVQVPYVREVATDLWFRTSFLPGAGKRSFLQFEQVVDECWIWVNGNLVKHQVGYEPFEVEIKTREGVDNKLAVRVAAKAGEQVGLGGRVTLTSTGPQRIEEPFIFTQALSTDSGEAEQLVRCELANLSETDFEGRLEANFLPWERPPVTERPVTAGIAVSIPEGGRTNAEFPIIVLPEARLWSPDHPQLYQVRLLLTDSNGGGVDDAVVITGIRKIEQKGNQILLNNQPFFMVGFLDTMNYPPKALLGTHGEITPSDDQIIRTILAAKLANANTIRIHPLGMRAPDRYLANGWPPFTAMTDGTNYGRYAEIADQLGIALIWPGRFWGWQISFLEGDKESQVVEQVPASVRGIRNHPSIIAHEGMNEVSLILKRMMDAGLTAEGRQKVERYRKIFRDYVKTINREDPTRLINPDANWVYATEGDLTLLPRVAGGQDPLPSNVYYNLHLYHGWYRPLDYMWTLSELFGRAKRDRALVIHELGSEAMPNWSMYQGHHWHGIWVNNATRYCGDLESNAIGRPLRVLEDSEYLLSQAYQALLFQVYATAIRNHGADGFTICTLADGFAHSHYHKGALDLMSRAKLGWIMARIVMGAYYASGADGDLVLAPSDSLRIKVSSIINARVGNRTLSVLVRDVEGKEVDRNTFTFTELPFGVTEAKRWSPHFPGEGFYFLEYELR